MPGYRGRRVVAASKYTGVYPQWFTWNVTITSPHTVSGTIKTVL